MHRAASGGWHTALNRVRMSNFHAAVNYLTSFDLRFMQARDHLAAQRRVAKAASQLLVTPTQSVKAWRSMLDAQWPHPDSQVNVLSASSLSLLYLAGSPDGGAATWGSSLASACLRQSHPGDIPPNLLSQQKARKLLAEQIHEFPQSPFIPPADSLRFVSTLHRAFSSLAEQGFVPIGPAGGVHAKPEHIPDHTWQLYTSWWNIKGMPLCS